MRVRSGPAVTPKIHRLPARIWTTTEQKVRSSSSLPAYVSKARVAFLGRWLRISTRLPLLGRADEGDRIGSDVRNWLPAQPVDATQALNLSAGVSYFKVSRGRSLS